MAKLEIAVIDYGMGNLRSVAKALELTGAKVLVTGEPARMREADAIVFPGVGSFGPAIDHLKRFRLIEPLRASIAGDKPFLGLCLGFQLLFDSSKEDGKHAGLGIIPGQVVKFDFRTKKESKYRNLKIPHMGWNQLTIDRETSGASMFKGIADRSYFYFVHSYYGRPKEDGVVAARTDYGIEFCAAVVKGKVWACQFHPEKSGANGLKLLKNFVTAAEK